MKTFEYYINGIKDIKSYYPFDGVTVSDEHIEKGIKVFTELKDFYDITYEIYPTVAGTFCISWKTKKWYISAEFHPDKIVYFKEEVVSIYSDEIGEYIQGIAYYDRLTQFKNLFNDIR